VLRGPISRLKLCPGVKHLCSTGLSVVRVVDRDVIIPWLVTGRGALVRITSTNICCSDLHMYEGRTDFETSRVSGHEHNNLTLNNLVHSVKFTGGIGTVGVFVPQDPGGPDQLSQQGKAVFDFGRFWFKGQKMGTGQCPVKAYNLTSVAARPTIVTMADSRLPGVLGTLEPLLDQYGYLAVAATVGVESFGIPAPGQTVVVVAAVYAGAGKLNIALVVLTAFAAAVVGDSLGYAIGHFGGRRLLLRFGRYVGLTHERLERAERFFARHGGKIVAAARFVDGLRQFNGLVAGVVEMPWPRFLGFNALGAAVWVGVWASLGYLAGTRIAAVYEEVRRYQWFLLGALVLIVAGVVIWRILRRRDDSGSAATEESRR
jgi:membrane protein DedA with SNARE-associated domain